MLSQRDKDKIADLLPSEIWLFFSLSGYTKSKLLKNDVSLKYYFSLSTEYQEKLLSLTDRQINFVAKLISNELKDTYLNLDVHILNKIDYFGYMEIIKILKANKSDRDYLFSNFIAEEIRIIALIDGSYNLINIDNLKKIKGVGVNLIGLTPEELVKLMYYVGIQLNVDDN